MLQKTETQNQTRTYMIRLTHVEGGAAVQQGKNDLCRKCHRVNWIATWGKEENLTSYFTHAQN